MAPDILVLSSWNQLIQGKHNLNTLSKPTINKQRKANIRYKSKLNIRLKQALTLPPPPEKNHGVTKTIRLMERSLFSER